MTAYTVKFKAEAITAAYSGKNGKCCCGCAGNHYRRADATAKDLAMIEKVAGIMSDPTIPFDLVESGTFVSKVIGKRLYIAYFDAR